MIISFKLKKALLARVQIPRTLRLEEVFDQQEWPRRWLTETLLGVAQPSSARAIVSHSSCNAAVESERPARRYQPPAFDRSPSTRCR
jgi:hypothetical protein